MTVNPPYSLDGKEPSDLPDLAVEVDAVHGCDCDPVSGPYPDEGEADPTMVKRYDKWNLWQCQKCGGIWWQHNVQADYGDPRMDMH